MSINIYAEEKLVFKISTIETSTKLVPTRVIFHKGQKLGFSSTWTQLVPGTNVEKHFL